MIYILLVFFCTGIIESDDIAAITQEIDRGLNFSKKCAMLVDSIKKKYNLVTTSFMLIKSNILEL